MIALGLLLVIGGLLIKFISPMDFPLGWILIVLGAVILIFSLLAKRK
jgi:hypothetical protein